MYDIIIKKFFLLIPVVLLLTGCGNNNTDEAITIDYEHIILDKKVTETPIPTITLSENDKEDNGNSNENNDSASDIVEIDGMKFTPVEDTVKVTAGKAYIRTGPSTSYSPVTLSKAGERFKRTAVGDGKWDQLQYQGETVYIWNEFIISVDE